MQKEIITAQGIQRLNAGKIDGTTGITNVDHCPRYAMSQPYCAGWNAEYANGQGLGAAAK